jgi:magnesium chelatase accessory protein
MPRLRARLILVVGTNDGMVPPSESYRLKTTLPSVEIVRLHGLGHLAHEEKPRDIATIIHRALAHEAVK